jgi:polysaccharide export outer membrane protein
MMPSLLRSILTAAFALCAAVASAQDAGKPADYKLGPGDSIKVQVYQNPELSVEARVSESGVVNYPLIGAINLGGLSITEAETKIAAALKQRDILKAPQVNINVTTVRGNQVAVLGQVQKPGRFPLETTNVRVSDMLAVAGGVAPTGDDVLVVSGTRGGQPFRKTVDIPALFAGTRPADDIVLAPGDTVFVGKAPMFYIYGEAQRPGPYRVERGMTVMQAIAQGGGVTARGSQDRLRLHRKGADGTVVQMTPRLTDPIQPEDVLFVRESLF